MMRKSDVAGSVYTCAILMSFLSCNPGSVAAATVTDSNATLTSFDAITGDLTFDWDLNSSYEINGTEVTLNSRDISNRRLDGTVYEFIIPNFYDPLPLKTIEITMTGANESAGRLDLPVVFDIKGTDVDYFNGGPAQIVPGSFVSGTQTPTLVTENWEMFPNPDYERVRLFVPLEFDLQSIAIATQSTTVVPLPASLWLFGSGMLGLAGIARRKASA